MTTTRSPSMWSLQGARTGTGRLRWSWQAQQGVPQGGLLHRPLASTLRGVPCTLPRGGTTAAIGGPGVGPRTTTVARAVMASAAPAMGARAPPAMSSMWRRGVRSTPHALRQPVPAPPQPHQGECGSVAFAPFTTPSARPRPVKFAAPQGPWRQVGGAVAALQRGGRMLAPGGGRKPRTGAPFQRSRMGRCAPMGALAAAASLQ